MFAIGTLQTDNLKANPIDLQFSLYPQLNATTFCDTNCVDPVLNKNVTYSLYFSAQYSNCSGIRVEKALCWIRLLNIISSSSHNAQNQTLAVKMTNGSVANTTSVGVLVLN